MFTFMDKVPFRKMLWLFPVVVTLHNVEEGIWMPQWPHTAQYMPVHVGERAFWLALTVVTLLVYYITYLGSKSKNGSFDAYLLMGAIGVVHLNVFFPHLLAAVVLREYAPGVVTGVLLNFPVTLYLMARARREGFVIPGKLKRATVLTAALAFSAIALLFYVGNKLL